MVNSSYENTKDQEDISLCILNPCEIFKLTKPITTSLQLLVEIPRLSGIIN